MNEQVQNVEITENTETQTVEQNEVKTFTQEKVNQIIQDRLKKMPSKEEFNEFKAWKESQKTNDEKIIELTQSNSAKDDEIKSKDQLIAILKSGITDNDDIEFIQFKVGKMVGGFTQENLTNYLANNDRFSKKEVEKKQTGFSQTNTNKPVSEEKTYLDNKYGKNPFYKR